MEYFRNSVGSVGKCLSDSKIDERNVHDVVLVGGSTCIKFFATEALHSLWSCFRHTQKSFCQCVGKAELCDWRDVEKQTSVQSPSEHGEFLMKLLGIASITLDVESGSLQVWCNLGPGYGSACLDDGGINRSLLSVFLEDGAESKWRTVPSVSQR